MQKYWSRDKVASQSHPPDLRDERTHNVHMTLAQAAIIIIIQVFGANTKQKRQYGVRSVRVVSDAVGCLSQTCVRAGVFFIFFYLSSSLVRLWSCAKWVWLSASRCSEATRERATLRTTRSASFQTCGVRFLLGRDTPLPTRLGCNLPKMCCPKTQDTSN